jgi:hypothetical protein
MKKAKHVFEADLDSFHSTTGTRPFLRDVWTPVLNVREHLNREQFDPRDRVRVTVEKIKAPKCRACGQKRTTGRGR